MRRLEGRRGKLPGHVFLTDNGPGSGYNDSDFFCLLSSSPTL